jgi:hypothetical protein
MAIRNGLTAFPLFCQGKTNQRYSVSFGEVVFLRRLSASVNRKYKRTSIQDKRVA